MKKFRLTLNGQDRHPSLSSGIEKSYIQDRLMPMLHSNTSNNHPTPVSALFSVTAGNLLDSTGAACSGSSTGSVAVTNTLSELLDRKEIIVYPFSLNPEGSNPAGAVNFSKVSHAKLSVDVDTLSTACTVDV